MGDVSGIRDYILYLKNQCGLQISLHPVEEESVIVPGDLMVFNIHENSYCAFLKNYPGAWQRCVQGQKAVFERCKRGAFCGTCYAGVREYVYPIGDGEKTVGFLCVSGYRAEDADGYLKKTAERFSIPYESLKGVYGSLKSEMLSKAESDTLIRPLCDMLELAYRKTEPRTEESLIVRMIRYVKQYHTQNLTLEELCRVFSCSRSYVSHNFKGHTGRTFREYLTDQRIANAKSLLQYSELSVTEIAFSVGFSDSNYFSNVFKKHTGASPMAYRKAVKP